MDTREDINAALAEMGEPPLGAGDVVRTGGDVRDSAVSAQPRIQLVEPKGHKRSDIVFISGRRIILDLERDQVVEALRQFTNQTELDYLELPTIDVVGETAANAVVVRNHMLISRRQVELIGTIGHYWTEHVPGRKMTNSDVAIERASAAAVADLRAGANIAKHLKLHKDNGRG